MKTKEFYFNFNYGEVARWEQVNCVFDGIIKTIPIIIAERVDKDGVMRYVAYHKTKRVCTTNLTSAIGMDSIQECISDVELWIRSYSVPFYLKMMDGTITRLKEQGRYLEPLKCTKPISFIKFKLLKIIK